VARVAAFIPDLLFGSNVIGALQAAGHEVELTADPSAVVGQPDLLIVDLTAEAPERIAAVRDIAVRKLGFYSHVEVEVREQAQDAGFDLVVPRSRMAREGAALVERLSASAADQ
jgi:hypothetical protein